MVWRAEMTERGISTARKTAMTTISIIVVELASLCLRSRLSFVKPKIDIRLKKEWLKTTIYEIFCETKD